MEKKTIIFTVLIILVVAGFFGFLYYRDTIFSKEILKLEILGPDTAKIGDEITYTVKYKNNGNFALQNPKLIFELPDNSLTEDDKLRLTQDLQDIYPGDENIVQFKARLLGKEGDVKTARAWLSYTPKNLSVRYESNTTLTTKIDSVPLTLTFDLPTKVEKGKEITYAINYFSNIDYPLENLSVKVDSINGFNVESGTPASLDNAEWKLATLSKAQGGRINIKGLITADAGSHLNFSAKLGMWQDGTFNVIKEASQDVEIINPLLSISQQVNGSANYIASGGESLHYEISFRNIGASPIYDLFATSKLDSSAFDLTTLTSPEGSVRPNEALIAWDSKQVFQLQHLSPQQEAKVTFDVKLKDNWVPSDAQVNNTLLKDEVTVSDISQEFDVKINSNLVLAQQAYYVNNQAGWQNSGPVPPQVGQATTYTIVWQVKNYFNDTNNVKVRMKLPMNVTLVDNFSPDSQASRFSFDNASREIVWLAGDLSAGSTSQTIYFQISFTPAQNQQGYQADLVGQATVSGEDQVTSRTISNFVPGVRTDLPDDQAHGGPVQ